METEKQETGLDDFLEALCASFEEELERQENVLAVCHGQAEAARAHDLEHLEARTRALALLTEEALGAERERFDLLERVVRHFELPVEEQTLTHLIAVTPAPWDRRMKEFQGRIQKTLEETRRVVRENAHFMRRSLRIVDGSLQTIMGTEPVMAPGYEDSGSEPAPTGRTSALIDARG